MTWVIVGVVVGVITAVALWRWRDRVDTSEVDPLFMAGIPMAGAGVALFTTIGAPGVALLAVGMTLMAVGAWRGRRHVR